MEPINQVDVNNARMMHNRSASEPDFGRSPRQVVIRFSFHLMFCILFADKGVFGFAVLNWLFDYCHFEVMIVSFQCLYKQICFWISDYLVVR